MHVCYIARGSFAHLPAYVEFFTGRGHRVSVIHLDPHPVAGAENYSAAVGRFHPDRGKWKLPFHLPLILRHLRALRPDILHAHYATSAGLLAALTGFDPLVVSCHGTDVLYGATGILRRPALKIAFARARVVHVVSQDMRERVVALGAAPSKVAVSNVGVDTTALALPRRIGSHSNLELLCTRRLEPVYDLETLLCAVALLEEGIGLRCTIAGGGARETELRALAVSLGVESRVIFLGGFAQEELPSLLTASDIYVSCSVSDGTSLSLLEGMSGMGSTGRERLVVQTPITARPRRGSRRSLQTTGALAGDGGCEPARGRGAR